MTNEAVASSSSAVVAARGCLPPPGANICVAAPAIKSAVDILMVTSMTLVYLDYHEQYAKLGCKYVMQIPTESVLQCKRQFAGSGQISEFHIFAPPQCHPRTVPPGVAAHYYLLR